MIVGTIIEPALNATGNSFNGVTSVIFYTELDAIEWCRIMSQGIVVSGTLIIPVAIMMNTNSGVKRWWYDGTEQTG